MTPTVWVLTTIVGYLNAAALYFASQLDAKEYRRKLTFHYAFFMISLPLWMNVPHNFNPKSWPLRLYYCATLYFGVFFFVVALVNVLKFTQNRVREYQIHTIDEIIDSEYRFEGATAILENMRKQPRVGHASAQALAI